MTKTLFGYLLGVLTLVLAPSVIAQVVIDEPVIDPVIEIQKPRYVTNKDEITFMESVINSATSTPETIDLIYQDAVLEKLDQILNAIKSLPQ